MDTQMRINGDKVRVLRGTKSWSQEHLATAAGVSARTVQRVEVESLGSAETRLALAAALGVDVEVLMPGASPAPQPDSVGRLPAGAWFGWGGGALCAIAAVLYNYHVGSMSQVDLCHDLGVICALLGTTMGLMCGVRGWQRSRPLAG